MTLGSQWSVLLPAGLLGLSWLWWAHRAATLPLPPPRRRWLVATRATFVVLLVVALAQPSCKLSRADVSVIFALDVSRSMDPSFVDDAADWIAESTNHPAVVAGRASVSSFVFAQRPLPVRDAAAFAPQNGALDTGATDLETAIQQAARSFPGERLPRLVVISDGRETRGRARMLLLRLQELGIRVFTAPPPGAPPVWIDSVEVPDPVYAAAPFTLEIVVGRQGGVGAPHDVLAPGEQADDIPPERFSELEVRADERLLTRRRIGESLGLQRVSVTVRLPDPGPAVVELRIPGADASAGVWQQAILVEPPRRVLYVEGRPQSASFLTNALLEAGLDVEGGTAARLPASTVELSRFDVVILSDVSPDDLEEDQMKALEGYVRDLGGGLLFAAGESTYGEDGYSDTAVERILPVRFDVDEQRSDVALIITLDKSYSMHGRKMALAREAAQAAFDVLQDSHRFGLVAFDWNPHVVVPLQFALNRAEISDAIRRIEASAQTNFFPALQMTLDLLSDTPARIKHVVLVSDGETYPDDYRGLIDRFVDADISVSTVAVGQEADRELLADIATWGGGRSYFIESAERVQEILIDEARNTVEDTVVEEGIQAVPVRTSLLLDDVDVATAPPLRGFVHVEAKDAAEVLLATPDDSPLLTHWRYGLGQSVVFSSDLKNRWAVAWIDWPGYGRLWAQLIRGIARGVSPPLDFRVDRAGDTARLRLRASGDNGQGLDRLDAFVEIVSPDGRRNTIALEPLTPGSYGAEWPLAPAPGPYLFRLLDTGEAGGPRVPTRLLLYSQTDEDLARPPDLGLLSDLSSVTGGVMRPQLADIFADYGDRAAVSIPLRPLLAGLALLCYLVDLGLRRLSGGSRERNHWVSG